MIVGAPIQIEGEPAEIAQLVSLLTSGEVAVEHVHRWTIAALDGSATVMGRCWCGQERQFDPHGPDSLAKWNSHLFERNDAPADRAAAISPPVAARTKATRKGGRKCGRCGEAGHRANKCPTRAAA